MKIRPKLITNYKLHNYNNLNKIKIYVKQYTKISKNL